MKKSLIFVTIFCFIILYNQSFSAEILTTKYGFTAAYNRGSFNTDEGYPNDPFLPFFVNSVGNGFSIGGAVLMPINYLSDYYLHSRIRMILSYDYYKNITLETNNNRLPNGFNSLYSSATSYTINKNVNRIFLDVQYSIKLQEVYLVVNVGSNIYYSAINQDSRRIKIMDGVSGRLDSLSTTTIPVKDQIIRYEENYRTAVFQEGADKSIPTFGAGLSAGIGTEFQIANITFTPMISTKINNHISNLLYFSLDVLF